MNDLPTLRDPGSAVVKTACMGNLNVAGTIVTALRCILTFKHRYFLLFYVSRSGHASRCFTIVQHANSEDYTFLFRLMGGATSASNVRVHEDLSDAFSGVFGKLSVMSYETHRGRMRTVGKSSVM